MVGGAGNDNFSGLGGNDRLSGGPGDDVLFGYAGNDAIDGGPGFDKALFAGSRALYTISKIGNGLVRVSGQDGTDTLSNVEQLISPMRPSPTITPTGSAIRWRRSARSRATAR
jgi:Ca2+-binding RTX toxin-like protein